MSSSRIYSLGGSPLSLLISHEIAKLSKQPKNLPNIILLLNDPLKLKRFLKNDSRISILGPEEPCFQYMAACAPPTLINDERAIIDNLVVAERNQHTISHQLKRYKASLNSNSNVLLINPPMNIYETLNSVVWDNETDNPNIYFASTTKDERSLLASNSSRNDNLIINQDITVGQKEFTVRMNPLLWNERIRLLLTRVPAISKTDDRLDVSPQLNSAIRENSIITVINKSKRFETVEIPFYEFNFIRFETAIINSCIESLSILYGCKYIHELLLVENINSVLGMLITEQIYILFKSYPYITNDPNCKIILDKERLLQLIMRKLQHGRNNKSSFSTEVSQFNQRAVNELNGYFVNLARRNNINCKWNLTLNWLLKGKTTIRKKQFMTTPYL